MPTDAQDTGLTVLITGASAGIGEELARVFAAAGHRLILVARSLDKLDSLAAELRADHNSVVTVIPLDLARKRASGELFEAVSQRGLAVDILVNNAGVIHTGSFLDMEPDQVLQMVQLNLGTLMASTRLFLEPMLARGHGRVLNVASVAAFQPLPGLSTYAATKAAVLSFTEAMAEELKGTGVTLTALCPGVTDTAMASQMSGFGMTEMPPGLMSNPRDVAKEGYAACMAGEVVRVPGVLNRLGTLWSQTQPRWVLRTLGGLVGRRLLKS